MKDKKKKKDKRTKNRNRDDDRPILSIDLFRLDEEWIEQPELFHTYAQKLADANSEFDTAKAGLEVTKAELDREIRQNPDSFELSKLTEPLITSTVLIQPEYSKANRILIEARHTRDILQATVNALDHRKKALEKLVELHGRDYFAVPTDRTKSMDGVEKDSIQKKRKKERG